MGELIRALRQAAVAALAGELIGAPTRAQMAKEAKAVFDEVYRTLPVALQGDVLQLAVAPTGEGGLGLPQDKHKQRHRIRPTRPEFRSQARAASWQPRS